MSDLLDTLNNPVLQTGISILVKSRPEIGLAIELFKSLAQGWQTQHDIGVAAAAIDRRAAEHIRRLVDKNISSFERAELEVRLHEDLTLLVKLGGL